MSKQSLFFVSAVAAIAGLATVPNAGADDRNGESVGPYRAVSYINPDIGEATANPNVDQESECDDPDQYDTQQQSDSGTDNRNVHNDACLFGGSNFSSRGEPRFDGPATFESTGAGYISACPDPDDGGPKTAKTRDRNGDGFADVCYQSGYQSKGTAGDTEYHARLNNYVGMQIGEQRVTFCYDPGFNGCADTNVKDQIVVKWGSSAISGGSGDGDEDDGRHSTSTR